MCGGYGGNNVMGQNYFQSLGYPIACVYVVPSSTQTLSYGAMLADGNSTKTFDHAYTITATRIA
jgi:hypothetical protein